MLRFSEHPEDASRIISPSARGDEIGTAERELAAHAGRARPHASRRAGSPRSASRSARSITICATCWPTPSSSPTACVSLTDPTVQRLAPKLIASLDRAIRLCDSTLNFGRRRRRRPGASRFGCPARGRGRRRPRPAAAERIDWTIEIAAELQVDADRDQLYRVLSNLCRNAVQALEQREGDGARARSSSPARRDGAVTVIDVRRHRAGRAGAGARPSVPGVPGRGAQRRHRASASPSPPSWCNAHGGQIALIEQRRRRHLPRHHPRRGGRPRARAPRST